MRICRGYSLPLTLVTLLTVACASSPGPAADPAPAPAGHLLIVGGGPRPAEVMERFVALAGGPGQARIAIIPTASGNPERAAESLTAELNGLGAAETIVVHAEDPAAADATLAARLEGVTGVWFSGGVQSRVTRAYKDTPVEDRLHALYRQGAVLGGTSAGAAIAPHDHGGGAPAGW